MAIFSRITEWWTRVLEDGPLPGWSKNVIGRRSTVLLTSGLFLGYQGLGMLQYHPPEVYLLQLGVAVAILPYEFWGAAFLVVGLLGVVAAFRCSLETHAFTAITALTTGWSGVFLIASFSSPGAFSSFVLWTLIAVVVSVTAGWREQ